MHLKKLFALFLSVLWLLSLCACRGDPEGPKLPENDDLVIRQDSISELWNAAVDKLNTAGSYRMSGTISSVAEMIYGESAALSDDIDLEPPTVVTSTIDCAYENGKMLYEASGTHPHRTYFDGKNYYHDAVIGGNPVKYFVSTSSFSVYDAALYLKHINAEMIFTPNVIESENGEKQISFTMPFALYKSEALQGWLGIVVDETHEAQDISVKATLDSNGNFISAYMSYSTVTQFGDESIGQELLVSLRLTDYGSTQVEAPADLAEYNDWTEEDVPESTAPFVEHDPEDVQ